MKNYTTKISKNGVFVVDNEGRHLFECIKGHQFYTHERYLKDKRKIHRSSGGCPHCHKDELKNLSLAAAKKNLIEGHQLIDSFIFTSKKNNNTVKYRITCPKGHIYEKATSHIKDGCPQCQEKVNVGQERVRVMMEKLFNAEFIHTRPEWLINPKTGNCLDLDGYNEDLKIAFEYQGRQHLHDNTQYAEDYKNQTQRDEIKKEVCKHNQVKLFIIEQPKSYEPEKFFNQVMKQLKKQHLALTLNFTDIDFSVINGHDYLQKKYSDFKNYVESQGFKLHTQSYGAMDDIFDFVCSNGHSIQMSGNNFRHYINTKKNICSDCHPLSFRHKTNYSKDNIQLEKSKNLGKEYGFNLISTTYQSVHEALSWTCEKGHTFERSIRQIQRTKEGKVCPHCVPLKIRENEEDKQKAAKTALDYHFKLISDNYENVHQQLRWECEKGHSFERSIRQIQRTKEGKVCPHCVPELKKDNSEDKQKAQQEGFKYGFTLITENYINVHQPLSWQCRNGHTFERSIRQIQRTKVGKLCPCC